MDAGILILGVMMIPVCEVTTYANESIKATY